MNGAQDMGGMMGFGPVPPETDEPVPRGLGAARFRPNPCDGRDRQLEHRQGPAARESLHPADYLTSSYYEIWIKGLEAMALTAASSRRRVEAGRRSRPGPVSVSCTAARWRRGCQRRTRATAREAPARFRSVSRLRPGHAPHRPYPTSPLCARQRGTVEAVTAPVLSGLQCARARREPAVALHRRFAARSYGVRSGPVGKCRLMPGRATLSRPEMLAAAVEGVAPLPRDPDVVPVFRQPWEAQAFAMTLLLHERGLFTWSEWAQVLGEAVRAAEVSGDDQDGSGYYRHWLAALEQLVAAKGIVPPEALEDRRAAWDRARRCDATRRADPS